ncbi:MAG TPA: DegV family protein [Anaerolineae bacterium]|nr:DegV family protein [Anaerolineae bacterium]
MTKVAVVTDSGVNLPETVQETHQINVVPLKVILGEQTLRDGVDITPSRFYELLRAASKLPTTSQPSTGDFVEVYSRLSGEVDAIVSIHLSELLSGTIKSALAARELVDHVPIEVIDSRSASVGLGFVVLAAAREAQRGGGLPEVVAAAKKLIPRINVIFVVDTLKYLHMGGRIGGASAMLGTALKIKPLLHLYEGQVNPLERVRSKCKATERMLEIMAQRLQGDDSEGVLHAAVAHADREDEALELKEQVLSRFQPDEFYLSELTPAIGTHAGPGTLGLGWYVGP